MTCLLKTLEVRYGGVRVRVWRLKRRSEDFGGGEWKGEEEAEENKKEKEAIEFRCIVSTSLVDSEIKID